MCTWCGLRHGGFNKYLRISYNLITLGETPGLCHRHALLKCRMSCNVLIDDMSRQLASPRLESSRASRVLFQFEIDSPTQIENRVSTNSSLFQEFRRATSGGWAVYLFCLFEFYLFWVLFEDSFFLLRKYPMYGLLLFWSRSLLKEFVEPDQHGFVRWPPVVAWPQRCVRSSGLWRICVLWPLFFGFFIVSSFHLRWSLEHMC